MCQSLTWRGEGGESLEMRSPITIAPSKIIGLRSTQEAEDALRQSGFMGLHQELTHKMKAFWKINQQLK